MRRRRRPRPGGVPRRSRWLWPAVRRARGSLTPEVILDAAETVAGQGFDALTIRAVASRLLAAAMLKQQTPGAYAANRTAKESLIIYPKGAPTGTGLTGNYFTNCSATYTNTINFNPANLILTTNDPVISFRWGPTNTPNLSNGFYCARWTGQVSPQYSAEKPGTGAPPRIVGYEVYDTVNVTVEGVGAPS